MNLSQQQNERCAFEAWGLDSQVQMMVVPKGGHGLDHWELDGFNVGSADSNTAIVDWNHMLKALPQGTVVPFET